LDLPDDSSPDPCDDADFELPDGNELVEAFMAGLAKEVDTEYIGLSQLIDSGQGFRVAFEAQALSSQCLDERCVWKMVLCWFGSLGRFAWS
jgi:hypothetical protein